MVDQALFNGTILPALRADAASATPALRTPPVIELHLRTDRARYAAADPAAALVSATALRRTIERIAPGAATVIDNVSDGLRSAQGDVTLAKILFLFLGIPGVLLAAYLANYATGLLAEAERRELATLRARGAGPAHLLRALAVETVVIGALGAIAGLALAAAVLTVLLGGPLPAGASAGALAGSAALAVAAGFLTTALALYLPRRFALLREATAERRELVPSGAAPFWLRAHVDLALIVLAAVVEAITVLAGGFKPTAAEGQSVSLSFYTLLSPLLLWAGLTLLLVRLVLVVARRRTPRANAPFGPLVAGLVRRALGRRSRPFVAGLIALALAVAFGTSLSLFVSTYARDQASDARFVVGADVRVTPSTQAPLALTDTTLAVPGVRDATAVIALSGVLVGSDKRALAAVDPAGYLAVAAPADAFFKPQTAAAAFAGLTDPTAILISDELVRRAGEDLQCATRRPGHAAAAASRRDARPSDVPCGRALHERPGVPAGGRSRREPRRRGGRDRTHDRRLLPRADGRDRRCVPRRRRRPAARAPERQHAPRPDREGGVQPGSSGRRWRRCSCRSSLGSSSSRRRCRRSPGPVCRPSPRSFSPAPPPRPPPERSRWAVCGRSNCSARTDAPATR